MTNQFTPGGDGTRIYPYLKYLQKVPETIPFWQAHKYHGYPLLADPENHMPWSLILDTESPHFNLCLNTVFILLSAAFAFICHSIARQFALSQAAALLVGMTTIFCVPVSRLFMHGTLSVLFAYVLIYGALLLFMIAIGDRGRYLLLIVPASIMLAWAFVTRGYYFLINFAVPALAFLTCFQVRNGKTIFSGLKSAGVLVAILSFLALMFAMPLFLPIIDGVLLSNTFSYVTPSIAITDEDIYNFRLNPWPFLFLALMFSQGKYRRYAMVLFTLAGINYFLIILNALGVNVFFDLWTHTPILRNIRWQHCFRELSSIASVFCAGVFLDSCAKDIGKSTSSRSGVPIILFCLLMAIVGTFQYLRSSPTTMIAISMLFMVMLLTVKVRRAAIVVCAAILLLLSLELKTSNEGGAFYTAPNRQVFMNYSGGYHWKNIYGYDEFTPVYRMESFALVFMKEYRFLLSLLYDQEIRAMRPHWVKNIDDVQNFKDKKIAQLMSITSSEKKRKPFTVFDDFIVADEPTAHAIMSDTGFSVNNPIILDRPPAIPVEKNGAQLRASVQLTGKTADSLNLKVRTNKNCIVFVPEIYHRDWDTFIGEREIQVIKAYGSMRAIVIPKGEHAVAMRFRYRPAYWGTAIGFFSLCCVLLGMIFFKPQLVAGLGRL